MDDPTYAPWPVWSGSTDKPVTFHPIPKKEAHRRYRLARQFDRVTKKGKGRHGGALGPTALRVLEALTFDFLNYTTGRLDPSLKAIADKANLSVSAVVTALKRLKDLRIIGWVRRCRESYRNGRYVREQETNAYAITPPSLWQGFEAPCEAPPPPHPATWGKPPVMPSVLEAAVMAQHPDGDRREAIGALETAPMRSLEAALARLGRSMQTAGKLSISPDSTP